MGVVGRITMGRRLVFDLETKKTFDQVGGQANVHLLGISVCGLYDYSTNKYEVYREEELTAMEELFREAELLIGFNSKHFDNRVLQPYFHRVKLADIPHHDILEEIVNKIGHRVKLESVAQSTLYEGKSGSGLDALVYYNEGDWNSLIKYCLDDVRITREVYEYGQRHGYLWYQKEGKPAQIPVDWVKYPTILEQLAHALSERKQIEITYIKVANGTVIREQRVMDIRAMDKEKIRAYCNNSNDERIFSISKIINVKVVGDMSSYQDALI